MVNILITKSKFSKNDFTNIIDWKAYGVSKLIPIDDFSEVAFENTEDIDFIVSDIETLSSKDFKLFKQITDKGLNDRLVLTGGDRNTRIFTYIASGGLRCYEPDILKFPEKLSDLISRAILKKEQENLFLTQLHDGSIVKKINQSLEKGDSRSLQKILVSVDKILPASIFQIKEYYLMLLQTIFDFAEKKGVRQIDKKEIISELIGMRDFETIQEFAIKKINSTVHLVEVDKNNQSKMFAAYIKDFIDENYMKQDTNAGNIAERFGVSNSYIGTLFREQQKTTITKYITQLRIEKAVQLLLNTQLQIQVISKKVGYSDQNYFARIFKKQTGLSPGEYRSKNLH